MYYSTKKRKTSESTSGGGGGGSHASAANDEHSKLVVENSVQQVDWCISELEKAKSQALLKIKSELDDIVKAVVTAATTREKQLEKQLTASYATRMKALQKQKVALRSWNDYCIPECRYLNDDEEAMVRFRCTAHCCAVCNVGSACR